MLQKNETVTIEITGVSSEGFGVGRATGIAVFVPGTAPGETIEARIVKVHRRYAYGRLMRIIAPSPHRIEPDCPAYGPCGGCCFRHITYEEELRIKRSQVEESLRRLGGLSCPVAPVLPSPLPDRYRGKAQIPVRPGADGAPVAGFFARNSHRIVPCADCLLQPAVFSQIVELVLSLCRDYGIPAYDEAAHRGLLRTIYLRQGLDGGLMVCLCVNGGGLPHKEEMIAALREGFPAIRSILLNVNRERGNTLLSREYIPLWGDGVLRHELCGLVFDVAPGAFFQVNRESAALLFRTVRAMLDPQPQDILLDLYCGAGTIGLTMADAVGELIGVESMPAAVDNARHNAALNGITNARFLCADAGAAAVGLLAEGVRPTLAVVDPPRKGCDAVLLDALLRLLPTRIAMVSCQTASLVRDLALLCDGGYRLVSVQPVDMFPRTAHVECVGLLERVE